MALNTFLEINMPYGFVLDNDCFIPFNRESSPLGSHIAAYDIEGYRQIWEHEKEFHTKYRRFTTKLIEEIATYIIRDEKGNITKFYLYDDSTKPTHSIKDLTSYFDKLKKLFKLKRDRRNDIGYFE